MKEIDRKQDEQEGGLKAWLDTIQRESWELELLVSGFVIFLLIGGWESVEAWKYDLYLLTEDSSAYFSLGFLYQVFRTAYLSLLACLLVHVVLRGVWIAAIGLRSVSGQIEYGHLPYQPRFTQRLRQRLGSFDGYIERLERNCSVIFSLAFLIIFCFLSLATWAIFSIAVQRVYLWIIGAGYQGTGVLGGAGIVSVLVFVTGLIYLFDFVTLGLLKRSRWLGRPYYYLYVFMGWVTLARLYRPLYYNLIDNRFGRRLAMLLPIIILLILVLVSVKQVKYAYFPAIVEDGTLWLDHYNYDDESSVVFDQLWRTSLASKYPEHNYLEVFVPYRPRLDDERLLAINPDLDVSRYTGTKLRGAFKIGTRNNLDADYDELLATFTALHRLSIDDTLSVDVTPLFSIHQERRQPGVKYMIPVHDLPVGRHHLKLQTQLLKADTLTWSDGYKIYFFK